MDKRKTPLYRVIYNDILAKIESGEYSPGDRIPTEAQWAEIYGVSRITSKKALDLAAENHIIHRRPGVGSFIAEDSKKMLGRKRNTRRCLIGVIQHDLSDTFGLELFQTIEKLAQEAGMLILAGFSNNDIETEKKLINNFCDYGVDGFIVSPLHNETFNNEILKLIIDGFPVVLIDRYLQDVSCPNVISKNYRAAYEGMNYLYSLGHRNIGVLSRPIGTTTTLTEREKGIMHAIVDAGHRFNPEWWLTSLEDIDGKSEAAFRTAKEQIRIFLEANKELTAIFGLKYAVVPVVEAVAAEMGLGIPEDLSLLCFDSPGPLIQQINPVTHLKQNEHEIASRAFDLIRRMLKGEEVEFRHEVEVDLVPGETTRRIDQD